MTCSASADALALVDAGPMKTVEWMLCATPMCRHCRPHEDVDQAAARILAGEVRRLRQLAQDWTLEANECRETARAYGKEGSVMAELQRHEYADALESCAKEIGWAEMPNIRS